MKVGEVTKYVGLHITFTSEPGHPERTDEETRWFARGLLEGMRGERLDALRWRGEQLLGEHPEAEACDVLVRLSDGERRFTWDEFDAWLRDDKAVQP